MSQYYAYMKNLSTNFLKLQLKVLLQPGSYAMRILIQCYHQLFRIYGSEYSKVRKHFSLIVLGVSCCILLFTTQEGYAYNAFV